QGLRLMNDIGFDDWQNGNASRARALIEENLAAAEELGSTWAIYAALNYSTLVFPALGDYARAREAALTVLNLPGSRRYMASGEVRLGQIDYLQGSLAAARAHFEAGLHIFRELNDGNGLNWVPA